MVAFAWSLPRVTHLSTNPFQWVPKVTRWVERLAGGKVDRTKSVVKAKLVEGETIAPVR